MFRPPRIPESILWPGPAAAARRRHRAQRGPLRGLRRRRHQGVGVVVGAAVGAVMGVAEAVVEVNRRLMVAGIRRTRRKRRRRRNRQTETVTPPAATLVTMTDLPLDRRGAEAAAAVGGEGTRSLTRLKLATSLSQPSSGRGKIWYSKT